MKNNQKRCKHCVTRNSLSRNTCSFVKICNKDVMDMYSPRWYIRFGDWRKRQKPKTYIGGMECNELDQPK